MEETDMRSVKLRNVLVALMLAAACTLGGCNYLAFIGYLFSPPPTHTVAPEFKELDGNTVAIVIVAHDKFVTSYNYFREQLSMIVSEELKRHLSDVKTVEASVVVRYQKTHPQWSATPQIELARRLGADYLMLVTVREYRLRPTGSSSLYHGHVTADVEVFNGARPESKSRVFWSPEISADYPEGDVPLGQLEGGLEKMRYELDRKFADALVRKFRYHKVKDEDNNE